MSKGAVLVIGSNATRIEVRGGGFSVTGQSLSELAVPAIALVAADYDLVLATPDGMKPRIDARSNCSLHFGDDEAAYARALAFYVSSPAMIRVRTLRSVIDGGLSRYAGVFVPGGYGPVVDLMQDAEVGEILRHFHERGKPTALLNQGSMALAATMPHAREFRASLVAQYPARASHWTRNWPYAGYTMTVCSTGEEKVAEEEVLKARFYFNLAEALSIAGAEVTTTRTDFEPNVVEHYELITGQNSYSDHLLATRLVAAL